MSNEDPIEAAKGAMQVVGDLIKVAGDDPNARRAASNIGKAAVTITGTINTLLLPFAAVNYGVERAKEYFTTKFADDLAARTTNIPQEDVVEPKSSIAGPAMQGLAYAHDEPQLQDLYLNLIATAMDRRSAPQAHPSFVEVLKQLSAEEARLLQTLPDGVFTSGNNIPVANVIVHAKGAIGIHHAYKHLLPLTLNTNNAPTEHADATVAAENWERLGLVEIRYDLQILVPGAYDWLDNRPEVTKIREAYPAPDNLVTFERGILRATSFGSRFAKAVGIA